MKSVCKFFFILLIFLAGKGECLLEQSIPQPGGLVEGNEGQLNVTIYCRVTLGGSPHATAWFFRRAGEPEDHRTVATDQTEGVAIAGRPLGPGTTNTFGTNFTILNLTLEWHETVVFCGAGANEDQQATNFTVKIFMRPSEPGAIIANDTGLDFATLSWGRPVNPGHPELTGYLLFIRREDGSSPMSLNTTATSENVTGLLQGAKYIASVRPISPMFETEFSDPLNFMTTVIPPVIECDGSPEEGNGVVTVGWSVIESGGVDVSVARIHVEYRASDSLSNFTALLSENITDVLQTSLDVITGGFLSGIEYTFRITAENEIGLGSPVECPPIRLETGQPHIPEVPTLNTVYPTIVILGLSTPQAGVGPGPHSFEFEVKVYQNNSVIRTSRKAFTHYENGERVDFTVDGLEVDREYRFAASASNEFGQSSFSNISESVLLEPSEPLIEEVDLTPSADQIAVTWTYIHTGGRPLTEVLVEYREGEDPYQLAPNGNLTDLSLRTLNFSGNLFKAGEYYQFRVTVTNQIGVGVPQEMMPFIAEIGIPQTPDTPSIESTRSNGVVLLLSTAVDGVLSPPGSLKFEVAIFLLDDSQRQQAIQEGEFPMYQDGEEVEFTIDGLESGEYQFSARAVNQFGMSEFSTMSEEVTVGAGGLTGGAVAGIVIGIIVVVIVIALIILILVCVGTKFCSCMLGGNTKDKAEPMPLEYTPNLYNSKTVPPDTTDGQGHHTRATYATIAEGSKSDHEMDTLHTHTPDFSSHRSSHDKLPEPKENEPESLYDTLAPTHNFSPHTSPSRDSTAHNPLYVRVGDPGITHGSARGSAEVEISFEAPDPAGSGYV